jgi:FtsZ-binding cell division protein ZapB
MFGLNLGIVAHKITKLQSSLREQNASRAKAETELATANENLTRVNQALRQTTAAWATTEEANKALITRVEEREARANQLSEKLALVQHELDDSKANLAAYESVMTIQQAVSASWQIKNLQQELTALKETNNDLTKVVTQQEAELNIDRGSIVFMPADLAGTISATDPKWQFVVLNAGKNQGVVKCGELLVSRGGKLVAKVIVQRVDKDRSIANVMPGWELTDILEGDKVMPAHPRS